MRELHGTRDPTGEYIDRDDRFGITAFAVIRSLSESADTVSMSARSDTAKPVSAPAPGTNEGGANAVVAHRELRFVDPQVFDY